MKQFQIKVLGEEEGGALPAVLIIIIIITILVGVIMSAMVIQDRFIQRDIDGLQARYTAEGAVFKFLATDSTLVTRDSIMVDSLEIILPDSSKANLLATQFGGFLKITSEATVGGQQKKITTLVGKAPPAEFTNAVVMGDIHSTLNLTGNTTINGNVMTGPLGVRKSDFKGEPYEGSVNGTINKKSSSPLPGYSGRFFRQEIRKSKKVLEHPPAGAVVLREGRYLASEISERGASSTLFVSGDLDIFSRKGTDWQKPLTIYATGEITLQGDILYAPFTRIAAGKSIDITGKLQGQHGLFIAESITIEEDISCSGQFLAKKIIDIRDDVYLQYPSVLFLESYIHGNARKGTIELSDESILDGIAIVPDPEEVLENDETGIILGEKATIRGAIVNSGRTTLRGTVMGTVATFQFSFFDPPTTFINWLKDDKIDVTQRPEGFTVPIGFTDNETYKHKKLDWIDHISNINNESQRKK